MSIQEDSYINIQSWMRTKLNLKGNELLVFSIIHGFSHDRDSWFNGSCNYLAEWCGCSRQTILSVLQSLIKKNLIIKNEHWLNGVKVCSYRVNFTGCQKILHGGCQNSLQGVSKNLTGGCQKILHNNIDKNNKEIIDNENIDKEIFEIQIIDTPIRKGNKSKIDKKIDSIIKKCIEYDIDESVIDLLEKFFRNLLEEKKMVTNDKVEAILIKLKKVDITTQKRAVQLSLDNGYMNIDPDWLKNKKNPYNPDIHINQNNQTREEHDKLVEMIRNNDPSMHRF